MMPDPSEIVLRAAMDISSVEGGTKQYSKLLQRLEQDTDRYVRQTESYAKSIDRAFAVTEDAATRFAQNIGRSMGQVRSALSEALEAPAKAAEATERVTFTGGGYKALYDRIKQYETYVERLEEATEATEVLDEAVEESVETDEEKGTSLDDVMGSLRTLRWEIVTVMFLWRLVSRVFTSVADQLSESVDATRAGRGIRTLAEVYGESADEIIRSMQRIGQGTVDNATIIGAAQEALSTGQARFAAVYDQVWRSAQLTAAVTGRDITKVFQDMVSALEDLDAAALDSAAPLANAETNMRMYAVSIGKTVDQLTDYERATVLVNSLQQNTNELVAHGAEEAVNLTKAWDQTRAMINNYKDAVFAMIGAMEQTGEVIARVGKVVSDVLRNWVLDIASYVAEIETWFEILGTPLPTLFAEGLRWNERYVENLNRALQTAQLFVSDYGDALERGAISADRFAISQQELRLQLVELASAGLQRALDAVDAYNRRVEKATRQYNARLERIELDYQQDLAKIDARAALARERAIRAANKRIEDEAKRSNDRIAQMQETHAMQMRHNQERFNLSRLNNEAMYQYQRLKYIAEGDVLAIEDLDAMHALQEEAAQRDFELQQRQAEEIFQLQLKYARMAAQEQARIIRESLQEQLAEIEQRRQEDRAAREQANQDQLELARRNYEDQLAELKESLQEQLQNIGRGLQDQLSAWSGGYDQVVELIRGVFGPGGTADALIQGFLDRSRNIRIMLQAYISTGMISGTRPSWSGQTGETPWNRGGYQYGGDFVATSPSVLSVGEVPERVQITPLTAFGGNIALSWSGQPISVMGQGSFEGMDMGAIAQRLTQEVVLVVRDAAFKRH